MEKNTDDSLYESRARYRLDGDIAPKGIKNNCSFKKEKLKMAKTYYDHDADPSLIQPRLTNQFHTEEI